MQMLVQILGIWLLLLSWYDDDRLGKFTRIARINKTIDRADEALAQKRYQTAIREYSRLENEFNHHSDYLSMNFGHACYLSGQTDKALEHYQKVGNALDAKIASEANRMMGKIAEQKGNFEQAEEAYKKALIKNPRNHTARQNLLDLRKRKPEPKPEEQQQKKKEQEEKEKQKQASSDYGNKNEQPNSQQKNQNQQGDKSEEQADDNEAAKGKDQQGTGKEKAERDAKGGKKTNASDGEAEGKEKEASNNKKDKKDNTNPLSFNQAEGDYQVSKEELKKMNLSPEKAKAMLEAMRNAEIQYLQQKQVKSIFNNKGNKQNW